MKRICLEKGYVSIVTSGYTKYRGGKQSNSRLNSDIEFILVIDTSRKALPECSENIDKVILEKKFLLLLKRRYCRNRLENMGRLTNGRLTINLSNESNKEVEFITQDGFSLSFDGDMAALDFTTLSSLNQILESCVCQNKIEELQELIRLTTVSYDIIGKKYIKLIPATLKKLAQKKYRQEYETMLTRIESLTTVRSDIYPLIKDKIEEIKVVAEIRFNN